MKDIDLVEVAAEARPAGLPDHGLRQVQVHAGAAAEGSAQEADDDHGQGSEAGPEDRHHDFDFKVKHVRRFIEEGNKVKVTVRFKGREMAHTELGWKMLHKMTELMADVAIGGEPPAHGRPHAQHDPAQAPSNRQRS